MSREPDRTNAVDRARNGRSIRPTGPLPHVGRESEQATFREAIDLMLRGYGGLVLVSGETGIGKTALLDQLPLMLPSSAAAILIGHCYDRAGSAPYGPWRRIFQAAPDEDGLPALAKRLASPDWHASAGNQHELFEMITDALRAFAARSPLILVIEDIHWADYASLELLRHISHYADETALLIVATYRTDSLEQSQELTDMIPRLVRESNTRRLDLKRLGRDDTLSLVTASYELPEADSQRLTDYLISRGEGNPFFTVELMRDLEGRGALVQGRDGWRLQDLTHAPVPAMVRQVISARVEQLAPESLELLETASVIGQNVPVDLWQAVTNASIETLVETIQQAETLQLAHETADGRNLRFNHALTRETIYHRRPALQRKQQHRLLAEMLARQAEPLPADVAHHFALAEDPRAVDWLVNAGEQAERLHAAHDAISSVSRAIELASISRGDAPATAYRIRGRSFATIGDFDAAHQDLQRALAAARHTHDQTGEWEALSEMGMLWSERDYRQAGECYQQALDVARDMNDQRSVARSMNRMGNWRANTGDLPAAIDLHQGALAVIEQQGDAPALLETHDLLGTTCFMAGDYRRALGHLEIAISEARRLDDRLRLASALSMVPMFGGNLDINFSAGVAASRDPGYWRDCAEEGLEVARNIGWKSGESFALATLGLISAVRGDLGRSLKLVEQGYSIARTIAHQQWLVLASLGLGMIWSELEDHKRAEYYLARCRATTDTIGSQLWSTLAHVHSAFAHLRMGDVDRASELLSPFLDDERSGRSNSQRSFQIVLAQVQLAEGDTEAALESAERLLALEEDTSVLTGIPQVLKIKADALSALGRAGEADQCYGAADHAAAVLELHGLCWRIKAAHSRLLQANGHDEASDVAREAAESIRRVSETIPDMSVRQRFVQRASQQLPKIRNGRGESDQDYGLSARELEVLRQVAQGLTNAEIGERLFISPRTVAQHLQSIYRKLGTESRTAATAFAHEHDLL